MKIKCDYNKSWKLWKICKSLKSNLTLGVNIKIFITYVLYLSQIMNPQHQIKKSLLSTLFWVPMWCLWSNKLPLLKSILTTISKMVKCLQNIHWDFQYCKFKFDTTQPALTIVFYDPRYNQLPTLEQQFFTRNSN